MKLTMLKGLPASGKSTLARQIVKESGNTGRVNRDDLRAMLFNSEWTGKREDVVIACEKAIASVLFEHGMNAVIDDTNLGQKHRSLWSDFTKSNGQHFEAVDLSVDIPTCVVRDAKRSPGVGRPVIERLALQNGLIDWGNRQIVIVDLDGTLADGRHREHFVTGDKKDWGSYFAACGQDGYIDLVCRWVHTLSPKFTVCLVSGRPDRFWAETSMWLMKSGWDDPRLSLYFDHIFMRSSSDKRPDTQVKADILKWIPKEKVAFVIDDRPSVVRMWRENGLRVIPVRGACEEF